MARLYPEYEEQTFYEGEDDMELDAKELCRKPKEASKPRDCHIIVDTSKFVGATEGSVQLSRIALRALFKSLSRDERIELSTSSEHGERILRRTAVQEVDEVDYENRLESLEARGPSHLFDNLLHRVTELDDLTDREVTLVVLAASMDEDAPSSTIIEEVGREMMRRSKLRFVLLGINLPAETATALQSLCAPHRNATFAELQDQPAAVIERLFSSQVAAKHALEIDIRKPYQAAVIGKPVEFCVIIRNNSDLSIPAGSRLYLNPNDYFRSSYVELPEVATDTVQRVHLLAQPKGRVSLHDLQEKCELSIQNREREVIASQPFYLDMVDFIGELGNKRHYLQGHCLNLYVIGAQGAGKGSFINTILTLLSDEDTVITAGADVGGGADHQTDRLTAFNISKTMRSTRLPKFPFRIFDTWGMDLTNYQNAELDNMLKGLLPNGWGMHDNASDLLQDMDRIKATVHQREAHAIFFFISFAQLEDTEHEDCLRAHFRNVKKLGFNPMVVLARVDELEPAIRDDPFNWKLPKIAKLRSRVAELLNVGLANVLVSVPYVTQDSLERNFQIEKLAYHNLRCGLDAAIHHLMTSAAGERKSKISYEEEDDEEEEDEEELAAEEGREEYDVRSYASETASQYSVSSSTGQRGRRAPQHRMGPQHYHRRRHCAGGLRRSHSATSSVTHGSYRGGSRQHHQHHHQDGPSPSSSGRGRSDPASERRTAQQQAPQQERQQQQHAATSVDEGGDDEPVLVPPQATAGAGVAAAAGTTTTTATTSSSRSEGAEDEYRSRYYGQQAS